MNDAIMSMMTRYDCKSSEDYENALKEIVQEVALVGLSRSGFFTQASFYGGTALRIFHGLRRFSEDMDFSLELLWTSHWEIIMDALKELNILKLKIIMGSWLGQITSK